MAASYPYQTPVLNPQVGYCNTVTAANASSYAGFACCCDDTVVAFTGNNSYGCAHSISQPTTNLNATVVGPSCARIDTSKNATTKLGLLKALLFASLLCSVAFASPAAERRASLSPQDLAPCTGCNSACGKFDKTSDDVLYTQYTQVTDPVTCGTDSNCSATYSTSSSIEWSFDVGAGGGSGGDSSGEKPSFGDISGTFGFSVSQSFETGEDSTGSCGPGETACVIYGQARASHQVEFECTNNRGCLNNGCDGTADVLVNNDSGNPKGCYVTLCSGCAGRGEVLSNPAATCNPQ